MAGNISFLITINILVQFPLIVYVIPQLYYPAYPVLLLLNVAGLLVILFAYLLDDRDRLSKKSSDRLEIWKKIISVLYVAIFATLMVYFIDLKRIEKEKIEWSVNSYSYDKYLSSEIGFEDGWESGKMDVESGKRKTIGAIGFSFKKEKKYDLVQMLPVKKDQEFIINYFSNRFLLFCGVLENGKDKELTEPVVLFVNPGSNQLKVAISELKFYNSIPEEERYIKHLKFNYNGRLSLFDVIIIKMLNVFGLEENIIKMFFSVRQVVMMVLSSEYSVLNTL